MIPTPRIYALIVAAGVGRRAGGEVPKQYQPIAGKPLLRYSCEALAAHQAIAGVQVVIHPEHREFYTQAVRLDSASPPAGEATRLAPHHTSPLGGEVGGGLSRSGEGASSVARTLAAAAPSQPSPARGEGAQVAPFSPKLLLPVTGGAERTDSVRAGLDALLPHAPDYVLIHDAARPFLSAAVIGALIQHLTPHQAVIPALPVADTVRRLEQGRWQEVSRDGLMRVQTPQAFPFAKLKEVVSRQSSVVSNKTQGSATTLLTTHDARRTTPTDEAALWLEAGLPLNYVAGEEELRKVTTAADIDWAQKKHATARRTAVGMGFDVHALMPSGEKGVIRLGGIDIAHGHKLHGHSDADVVLHAIVDALLGTIGAGDIGSHFPPTDARWKGANSSLFIEEARAQVAARGGEIQHLDITIIGEQPKISPHREAMREAIATLLKLPLARVSVKATTTEKLGLTGREEGIACQAVATVSLPEAA